MKRILLIFALATLVSLVAHTQCSYRKSITNYTKYVVSDSKPEIERATPPFYINQNFGEKYSSAILYSFAMSGPDYYLYIHFIGGHFRSWFSKMRITAENSIKLSMGDSIITLYPCGTFSGKSTINANYVMGAFYRITIPELEYISENKVDQFEISFEALNKEKKDQEGKFELQQMTDKFDRSKRQEKFMVLAGCILSLDK